MTQTTHVRFAALLAAGFFASTTGIAYADTTTSGDGSIGGGNQVEADLDAPINVCGNAIAVLGLSGADCTDGEASVTGASSTSAPRDSDEDPGGYDGYYPEDPEDPEEPVEEEPEEPVEEEPPEDKEREEQVEEEPSEEPSEVPSESASPSAPPADEHRLAVTGADQGALTGLVAAAILTVAAGAGLLLFGRRRKSES